ncbi:uncharacterized protein LOC134247401 isoform X2 [Saccostrea cucullata]|uniref:uncharacterized protein LOC134247401 isoform X2 n=1 Tax=Saccostrea cuccullata TaxID=36930 RepID=UPI002ED0F5E5
MIVFFFAIFTPAATGSGDIRYVEYTTQVKLNCDCLSKDSLSKSKRWYKNGSLIEIISKDEWGPLLVDNGDTLLVQSVQNLKENITYECRVVLGDESEHVCKSYIVKAFQCRHHSESIEPQNLTNLAVGDSPVFTCKHYFSCDKVNENHSVSMKTYAKHRENLPCTISDHGLTHECKLKIKNIAEDDFGKTIQCVVNDSGIISVHEAFLIKRESSTITFQHNVPALPVILLVFITLVVVSACIVIILNCYIKKQKPPPCSTFPNKDQKDYQCAYHINPSPVWSSLTSHKKTTSSEYLIEEYI